MPPCIVMLPKGELGGHLQALPSCMRTEQLHTLTFGRVSQLCFSEITYLGKADVKFVSRNTSKECAVACSNFISAISPVWGLFEHSWRSHPWSLVTSYPNLSCCDPCDDNSCPRHIILSSMLARDDHLIPIRQLSNNVKVVPSQCLGLCSHCW